MFVCLFHCLLQLFVCSFCLFLCGIFSFLSLFLVFSLLFIHFDTLNIDLIFGWPVHVHLACIETVVSCKVSVE